MLTINWDKDPYKFWLKFTGGLKKEAIEAMGLAIQLKNIGLTEYPEIQIVKEGVQNEN